MDGLLALSNELAAAVDRAGRSVVGVAARPRLHSTGVHWRQGFVVTANHTVQIEEGITVTRPDGRTVAATLAARDPAIDVAILKVDTFDVGVAEVADSSAARVGHIVLALGAGPRASLGVISAIGGEEDSENVAPEVLSLDLTLYPGFSGGPLVNTAGHVLGLLTSGRSRHLQLAVPATSVNRVVDELVRRGHLPHAYLGVGTQPVRLPASIRERLGLAQQTAVIVVDVQPGSPAASGNLSIGDVILSIGGTSITDPYDLKRVLRPDRVGQRLAVSVWRADGPRELEVVVAERPARA
jgi:S1-C subfamily serine protease